MNQNSYHQFNRECIIYYLALLGFIWHDVNDRRWSATGTKQIQLIQRFQSSLQTHTYAYNVRRDIG